MDTLYLFLAQAVPPSTEAGDTWWEEALKQFPVAALLMIVVYVFLKEMRRKDESYTGSIEKIASEDRDDRREQADAEAKSRSDNTRVLVDTLKGMDERSGEAAKAQTSSFNTLSARTLDSLDQSTAVMGELKGVLSTMQGVPAVKAPPKKRTKKS